MAELTVMTWNVQNLLPVGHPDGPATEGEYRAKLAAVAGVIDAVAPDVVALQEVGPEQVLADLNEGCVVDFDHRLTGSEDRRGIRVALLSPRRLSRRRNHQEFPPGVVPVQHRDIVFEPATISTTSRGILSATVRSGGETVTVITCHLTSKLISYDRQPGVVDGSQFAPNDEGERLRYAGYALARRGAEAMTCRATLDELLTAAGDPVGDGAGTGRDRPVVLCGDLNDEPLAATTQIIKAPADPRSTSVPAPASKPVIRATAGGCGTSTGSSHSKGPTTPASIAAAANSSTTSSPPTASSTPPTSPPSRFVAATPLPSMTDTPVPHLPSDHAAVVATFTI